MKTIYVVISSSGSYDDYGHWNEKAFSSREEAEKYAKKLDEKHNYKPQFITDEFEALLQECEALLPEWEDFPCEQITDENRADFIKWQEEQEDKQDRLLFDLMYQRGQFMTKNMYNQYQEWVDNKYEEWHDCRIEELELI